MKIFIILFFLVISAKAQQGWSLNLGYNNPPGATVGLNFMYLWSKWAFEIGAGSAKVNDKNNSSTELSILTGQVDLKYLFGSGGFRPYAQLGTGYALSSNNNSAGLGVGGSLYGGLGFFGMGSSVYGYASYNLGNASSSSGFIQLGIGFNL